MVWKHGKRPVICAIAGISKRLQLDNPSSYNAAASTQDEAAKLTGIVAKLVPHDIRRGAAHEAAHLPGTGNAMEQAHPGS